MQISVITSGDWYINYSNQLKLKTFIIYNQKYPFLEVPFYFLNKLFLLIRKL